MKKRMCKLVFSLLTAAVAAASAVPAAAAGKIKVYPASGIYGNDVYGQVVNEYRELLAGHLSADKYDDVCYVLDTSSSENVGAALVDVDGDGNAELLTGKMEAGEGESGNMIYDIYGNVGGNAAHLAFSWLRGRVYFTGEGFIYTSCFQEGAYHYTLSQVVSGADKLKPYKEIINGGEDALELVIHSDSGERRITPSDADCEAELNTFWDEATLVKVPFTSFAEMEAEYGGASSGAGGQTTGTAAPGAVDYTTAFDSAFAEVENLRQPYLQDPTYYFYGYTLCDLTGDGIREIVFKQVDSKRGAHYWVYTPDGSGCRFMGDFEADNGVDIGGYRNGVIYEWYYKGGVGIYAYLWNGGTGFEENEIYQGSYDRNANPPTIGDLSGYFDAENIIEWAPEFVEVTDRSYLSGNGVWTKGASSGGSSSGSGATVPIYCGINVPESEFLYPDSSSRRYTKSEFDRLFAGNARERYYKSQIFIDEIFVRYGYDFSAKTKAPGKATYERYRNADWYQTAIRNCPSQNMDDLMFKYMSAVELDNILLVNDWQVDVYVESY